MCRYDGDEPGPEVIESPGSDDGEVRERLARLEKLLEMMLIKEKDGREVAARTSAGSSVAIARGTLLGLTQSASSPASQPHSPHPNIVSANSAESALVGQIVFKELHSAYFDADFWAGLVGEVSSCPKYKQRTC